MTPNSGTPAQGGEVDCKNLGYWDEDAKLHLIATSELGLPQATVVDDSEAMELIRRWYEGELTLANPVAVPLAAIDASLQGVIRRDVLGFYLANVERTYDPTPSSWGAEGPLAVTVRPGRTVLVDGTHRWAAARLRGDSSFSAQILRATDVAS